MNKLRLGRRQALSSGLAAIVTTAPSLGKTEALAQAALAQQDEDEEIYVARKKLFEQTFMAWLATESQRFSLPVSVKSASPEEIELRVQGIHPAISISLGSSEINIGILWDSEWWDYLVWLDCYEEPAPGGVGFVNSIVLPEYRIAYPTLEALWCAEVFEDFLTWINEDLAQASEVAMWQTSGGSTWARLISDGKVLGTRWTIEENGGTPAHLFQVHGHPL
jgi:hypothetical protein